MKPLDRFIVTMGVIFFGCVIWFVGLRTVKPAPTIEETTDTLTITLIDEAVIIRAVIADTVIWQMEDGGVMTIERHGNKPSEVQTVLRGKGKP